MLQACWPFSCAGTGRNVQRSSTQSFQWAIHNHSSGLKSSLCPRKMLRLGSFSSVWKPRHPSGSLDNNALNGMQSPSASCAEFRPKKGSNLSRERMTSELRSLRAEAARLEDTLALLRLRREHDLACHVDRSGHLTDTAPVWEQVAARQIRATKKLEGQNAKLRRQLSSQQGVAEYLGVLVSEAQEVCDTQQSTLPHILRSTVERMPSLEPTESELETLCASAGDAFAHTSRFSDGVTLRFFNTRVVEDDVYNVVVDLYASWMLPFDRGDVEAAVWTQADADPSASALDAAASCRHKTELHGQHKTRCERGSDCCLLVVRVTLMKPICECRFISGVDFREDSWLRIVDADDIGNLHLDSPVVVAQQVCRLHLRFEDDVQSDKKERVVEELTASMEMRMRRAMQRVENDLLIFRSSTESVDPHRISGTS